MIVENNRRENCSWRGSVIQGGKVMMSLGGYRRASNTRRAIVVTHSARFLRLECPIISRQFVSEKTKQMKEEERKKNRMGLRRQIRPKL